MNQLSSWNNWLKLEDFRKTIDHFRGIQRICLKSIKKNQKMSTHNQSKSSCLQVQPVACFDLLVFLYQFEVYSMNSSIMISNFSLLFGKLSWFICNQWLVLPVHWMEVVRLRNNKISTDHAQQSPWTRLLRSDDIIPISLVACLLKPDLDRKEPNVSCWRGQQVYKKSVFNIKLTLNTFSTRHGHDGDVLLKLYNMNINCDVYKLWNEYIW